MTLFEILSQRNGSYVKAVLIHLHNADDSISMRFTSDSEDTTYGGNTYISGAFTYSGNSSNMGFSGGGTLEITTEENLVIDLIDTSRAIQLDVVGVILDNGLIYDFETDSHLYGSVTVERGKASFTFSADDRLNMTFPSLIWSNQNNRGNS